jgi:hypothetical protein
MAKMTRWLDCAWVLASERRESAEGGACAKATVAKTRPDKIQLLMRTSLLCDAAEFEFTLPQELQTVLMFLIQRAEPCPIISKDE